VGAGEPLPNELDFRRIESARDQRRGAVSAHQPVQNLVGLCVADSKIPFIGLALYQIG